MSGHLRMEERDRIAQLHYRGGSRAEIGRALGRDKSTIGRELRRNEPVWCQLPEGRLHALFRDNGRSNRLYQAFSSDSGRTWTRPRLTNYPNSTSQCDTLRLSNGSWALLSNANPKSGRRELHISLSPDGVIFTRMARLEIPSKQPTTFQYPHAIEHDDYLLISFSQKKLQTEVLKVPLRDLESL